LPATAVAARADRNKDLNELFISGGVIVWRGPYLSLDSADLHNSYYIGFPNYALSLSSMEIHNFAADQSVCVSGNICYYWFYLNRMTVSVSTGLNDLIDGESSSDSNGRLRYFCDLSQNICSIYYRSIVLSNNWS